MKSRFSNWSDLRVFLAVMEQGSTLAASRSLDMSQPTVARRIDALEHELGLSLFHRDTRGFRPTEDAEAILDDAKAVRHAAETFAAKASRRRPEQPIRITAFTANLSRKVTDIIGSYSLEHPESSFELIPSVKTLDLMAGEADIALRLAIRVEDDRLIRRHISTARFAVYASEAYAAKHGYPRSPSEMRGHRVLTYERPDMLRTSAEWILRHVPRDEVTKVFSEIELYDAAIRAGQGIGVINLRMAEDDERAGKLIRCFDPIEEMNLEHVMLVSPVAYKRPEVRNFTKYFAPRYAALFK